MLRLLEFGAEWCAPCKIVKPIVEQFASANNVLLEYCDISDNDALASKHSVRNIPTILVLDDDKEVARFVGAQRDLKVKLEAAFLK